MKEKEITFNKLKRVTLKTLLFAFIRRGILKAEPCDGACMPKKINNYRFVKLLEKEGGNHHFCLSIYENRNGRKVIVKTWKGNIKDYTYYTFMNEIVVYFVIQRAVKRLKNVISKKYPKVRVPKIIFCFESESMVILGIEYVEGEIAQYLPSEKKLKIYLQAVGFLHFLGNHMIKKERLLLSSRSSFYYVLLYPLLIIKASFVHPKAIAQMLRGIRVFVCSIPALLRNNRVALSHKDLHFKNIMINAENIYIIDLQMVSFAHELHDFVTILRMRWNEEKFPILLLSEMKKMYSKNVDFVPLLKGLIVHNATHGLTGNFPEKKINYWIDYLTFGTTLKNKKFVYKNL